MNQKSETLLPENDLERDASVESNERPETAEQPRNPAARLEPTRYGDWEKNGRCIDF